MNGATLNIHGMGMVTNDPQIRKFGERQRATVELAEYPENPRTQTFKRANVRVDLQLRQGDAVPAKGDVIVLDSAIYSIDLKEINGAEKMFTNLLAFAWRMLPKTAAQQPKPKVITASTDIPDPATSPAMAAVVDEEDVPF